MNIGDVEIDGLVEFVDGDACTFNSTGLVRKVISIVGNMVRLMGSNKQTSTYRPSRFRPWTPTLDDEGRIIWPGGDCPLLAGEKAKIWFETGSNWTEDKRTTWWDKSRKSSRGCADIDWDKTGLISGLKPTHFLPLGKAAERLLVSVGSSEYKFAVGDFAIINGIYDNHNYGAKAGMILPIVRVDGQRPWTSSPSGTDLCFNHNDLKLYATTAEHKIYLETEVPLGVEKLPFDNGGWGVPGEGQQWIGKSGALLGMYCGDFITPNTKGEKRVIVRKIEATVNEPKEYSEGQWIPHTTNQMPVGGDELVQFRMPHGQNISYSLCSDVEWDNSKRGNVPIIHYRVLPQLPGGEEHTGKFDFAGKGSRIYDSFVCEAMDWIIETRSKTKRWILKPRNENKPTDVPMDTMKDEIVYLNQGEDMKTDEELLKKAPEQLGYERSVGVPRTGRFRKDLFYSPIDRKITKRDDLLTSRRGGRRVIYRKKKSKLRRATGWTASKVWRGGEIGATATFLAVMATLAVGTSAHFMDYLPDASVVLEKANSFVQGLNQR